MVRIYTLRSTLIPLYRNKGWVNKVTATKWSITDESVKIMTIKTRSDRHKNKSISQTSWVNTEGKKTGRKEWITVDHRNRMYGDKELRASKDNKLIDRRKVESEKKMERLFTHD